MADSDHVARILCARARALLVLQQLRSTGTDTDTDGEPCPLHLVQQTEAEAWRVQMQAGRFNVHCYVDDCLRGSARLLAAPDRPPVSRKAVEAAREHTRIDDLLSEAEAKAAANRRRCPRCAGTSVFSYVTQVQRADEAPRASRFCQDCNCRVG